MKLEVRSHPIYGTAHHVDGGGFQNVWGPARNAPVLRSIQWVIGHSLRNKDGPLPPFIPIDPDSLKHLPDRLRITWIGHSTTLIQTPSLTLLTDPIFSERASPFSFAGPDRKPPLPLQLDELPGVDVVLISHDHYDHLDEHTIRELQAGHSPLFLVPLGIGDILRNWGAVNVAELDWWQYVELGAARFHCTPAKHFSGRALTGRNGTLCASWYVELPESGLRLYYGGDTGYAAHFNLIREQLGAPDVALIPIGAYLPRWFMEPVHVDPGEAMQAFKDIGASHFIPIHWGTFDLADEWITDPMDRARQEAAQQGLSEQLHALGIGESWTLPPASPRPE